MAKRMLIDATHPEETRVVVLDGNRLDEFDFETSTKKQVKGNIYLAKITRVEPSLQAAFVDFGGNRHGFLAFSEIHPDYYRIPVGDRAPLRDERREHDGRRGRHRGDVREDDAFDKDGEPAEYGNNRVTESQIENHRSGIAEDDHPATGMPAEPVHSDVVAVPTSDDLPAAEAHPIAAEPAAQAPVDVTSAEASAAEAPFPDAGDRDYARAERSTADAVSTLPAEFEGAETSDASGFAVEPGIAEAAATGPQVAETAVAELAPAETVETVGGDEFEEAARQRSRSLRHYKIQEVVKRRQIMLVQVTKEERGNKGAALTTYLSLAGRYCVLMPNTGRGGGVSRKITSATDRRRLKELLEELDLPEGMGVIVRTAGSERSKAEIKRDLEYLLRLWDEIRSLTLQSTAPALIYEEGNLIKRSIRDLYARDIDEVLVEGEEGYKTAKAFMKMLMPSHAKRVQPYRDPAIPLFHRFQVETQIDLIHSPVVQLRSGGYIVINPTEALVAIDVNSGRSTKERNIEETALRTNLEAAEEVARQLRLRDLAGLIVIDFIDMDEHRNQAAVERRLKEGMKYDRARIQLGRISPFGLLELSRQRLRPSLVEASTQPCPHCAGTGHIRSTESTALHVLRAIEEEGIRRRSAEICIYVPTAVALYVLNQKREMLAQIEARYGFRVTVAHDDTLIPPAFRLERLRNLTPAEAATIPAAIVQLPPPVEDDEEESDESAEATREAASYDDDDRAGDVRRSGAHQDDVRPSDARPGDGQVGEEMSEEERGRRRRRRRRRRRPGDEHEAGRIYQPRDEPAEAVGHSHARVEGDGQPSAEDFAGGQAHLSTSTDVEIGQLGVESAGEGFAPTPGTGGESDQPGRKRRRRGKRGGRRRGRGDVAGRQPGDEAADFGRDGSATQDGSAPIAAAEQVEIVHQPPGSGDTMRQGPGLDTAFTTAPLPVGEEAIGTAEAPVLEAGETAREVQPALFPTASDAAAPKEPHRAVAQTDSDGAAPPKSSSPAPDAKLVTEKPANPKRGWWQRLIDS